MYVVGAGSVGSVLASRLYEYPGVRAAVIEAGPRDTADEIALPVAFPSLLKSPLDRDYDTEPEPRLHSRRAYLPRGRMLGGSSSLNAMIYIRGARADYDGWAASGADGRSYHEVLPYFLKAADNERGKHFAAHAAQTLNHPTSTCAIGAVVDPSLRVPGLRGLRVADPSVMPNVVRGNTNAPTIMNGEKAAVMIVEDADSEGIQR
ncbi:GMC oxidoreductase [Nocardia sp. NPDC050710]|uniref:GMC oxidoreductase n=1 Tax=Nocardia sp. NPDC050710 TaxID=3157220 RepID=UPI00341195E0